MNNKLLNFIERVELEMEELDWKIAKLYTFIDSNTTFKDLDDAMQDLLKGQLKHMKRYSGVLNTRLELLKKEDK